MLKKRLAKWSLLIAGTTLPAVIPGCDVLTDIIDQLLGGVGGA